MNDKNKIEDIREILKQNFHFYRRKWDKDDPCMLEPIIPEFRDEWFVFEWVIKEIRNVVGNIPLED